MCLLWARSTICIFSCVGKSGSLNEGNESKQFYEGCGLVKSVGLAFD